MSEKPEQTRERKNIELYSRNFFETDTMPIEGDIVFVGCRRELVIEDVPENEEHKHLIRTARQENEGCVERTYSIEPAEKMYRLTCLGSSTGFRNSELYNKRLKEAGF